MYARRVGGVRECSIEPQDEQRGFQEEVTKESRV
jgi:hypothetical protein